MKKGLFFLAVLSLLSLPGYSEKIATLIISGDDVAPYHDWNEIGQCTREVLTNSDKFDVRICEEPGILESKDTLKRYDLIVLTMYNATLPTINAAAKENLLNFVKEGKGFVVCHLATASFKEWDEFGKLCGRKWVMGKSGHGPREVFEAKVVGKDHPITKGITDFKIFDELYSKLEGDAPITVLVEADSPWSKKTEPLCFVQDYGKGRVFNTGFGHDSKAIKDKTNVKLLVRGCEWAATGKVTE